jgi:hypothetical protein
MRWAIVVGTDRGCSTQTRCRNSAGHFRVLKTLLLVSLPELLATSGRVVVLRAGAETFFLLVMTGKEDLYDCRKQEEETGTPISTTFLI